MPPKRKWKHDGNHENLDEPEEKVSRPEKPPSNEDEDDSTSSSTSSSSSENSSESDNDNDSQHKNSESAQEVESCPLRSLRESVCGDAQYDQHLFDLEDYFSPNSGNGPVDPVFVDEDSSVDAAASVHVDLYDQDDDDASNFSMSTSRLVEIRDPPPPAPPEPESDAERPPPPPLPPSPSPPETNESASSLNPKLSPDSTFENGDDDDDSSMDEEEISEILDQNFVTNAEDQNASKGTWLEVERYTLIEKNKNHFEVLPAGWIRVIHSSGIPIFLHKPSRVVTLSMPYSIGRGSVKLHNIPMTSIPCFNYRQNDQDKNDTVTKISSAENLDPQPEPASQSSSTPVESQKELDTSKPELNIPKASLQEVTEVREKTLLKAHEVREYCQNLFQFQKTTHKKFKSWSERRRNCREEITKKMNAVKKAVSESRRGELLPEGTKIITIPVVEMAPIDNEASQDSKGLNHQIVRKSKKDWFINPAGKSAVCILHEYLQHSMKQAPIYKFSEVESATTPYCAVIEINGVEYAKGYGSSKKIAKNQAALHTLGILIPEFRKVETKSGNVVGESLDESFFDNIRIEDPRVPQYCNLMSEPSPYAVLLTCLQKNFGIGNTNIDMSLTPARNQMNEFKMKVNQREVKVICKNKRDGKQLASQKLLQLLHPNVSSWGSLVRMYGSKAISAQRSKKEKESEVTSLQSRAVSENTPSIAILEKLRQEMRLLAARKHQVEPIGKLSLPTSFSGKNCEIFEKIDL